MSETIAFSHTRIRDVIRVDAPICYGVLKPGRIVPGGVRLIRIVDIPNNKLETAKLFRIGDSLDTEFQRSRLRGGELLLSIQGTIGRVAIVPESLNGANISRTIARLDIDNDFSTAYVRHFLLSDEGQRLLSDAVIGTTRDSLNLGALRELLLPHPPLPEQRKIASILTTVDSLIEQTEALIEKYRRVKQGMMADLLSRGVDSDGKLRPTQQQAPELYKQSELGWIPRGWEVRELGHFLSYISYGFTNPMPETADGPWMVTAANVNGGKVQYKTCRHTSRTAYDTLLTNKCRPRINDILLTKDGTLGRLAVVDRPGICINQSVAVLRINERTSSQFIKLLLESPKYQQKMLDDAGGSTIKHIYITIVDKMLIVAPKDTDEQDRISELINLQTTVVAKEKLQLAKLRTLKTGLMQDLLTGKVRVKVDQDEEATADV